jgi:predicted house-cleaning noncanonical NTP pyrophosphatase (MazG superfamily)
MIIDNPNPSLLLSTSEVLGGRHQSTALFRTITLLALTQKIKNLSKKRYNEILSRKEVENDVVECQRKKSFEKLEKTLELINRLFGHIDEDKKEFLIDGNLSVNVSVSTVL